MPSMNGMTRRDAIKTATAVAVAPREWATAATTAKPSRRGLDIAPVPLTEALSYLRRQAEMAVQTVGARMPCKVSVGEVYAHTSCYNHCRTGEKIRDEMLVVRMVCSDDVSEVGFCNLFYARSFDVWMQPEKYVVGDSVDFCSQYILRSVEKEIVRLKPYVKNLLRMQAEADLKRRQSRRLAEDCDVQEPNDIRTWEWEGGFAL